MLKLHSNVYQTWGDNFFINYLGCDVYDAGIYTTDPALASNIVGGLMLCATPMPRPILSIFYYYSFITIGSFGILSSIIGIIGDSMEESISNSHKRIQKSEEETFEFKADDLVQRLWELYCRETR
jgi:hypothetical protein